MNQNAKKLLLAGIVSFAAVAAAWAQGEDEEPRRCISLRSIDHTEIIDDRNIAFHMRGNRIYINELDASCNGLEREGRFSYQTSSGQLCRSDTITVLEDSGFGLRAGFTCRLRMFEPADKDLIAILKGEEDPAEITVEDIEVEDIEVEE